MSKCAVLLTFFVFLLLAWAHPIAAEESAFLPVQQAACEGLKDKEIYKKKNLSNYKLMLPGKDEWAFRSIVSFKKDFSINDKTLGYIKLLQEGFRQHGTEFIILLPPSRSLVHFDKISDADKKEFNFTDQNNENAWQSYRDTIKNLKDNNVHVVGVENIPADGNFYYKRDHHWSPYGARITAEKVANYIKDLTVYDDIKKKEYQTVQLENKAYKGTFTKAFEAICGNKLVPEQVPSFETELIENAVTDKALFDEDYPEITLLGTSNSASQPNVSNFDGFLKEALQADVSNKALAGAGIDTSIISYLNSDEFKDNPPKIIIWEVPGYYNINRMNGQVFLQAIPATKGICEESPIAEQRKVIDQKQLTFFTDLKNKNVKGMGHYLSLEFSEPIMDKFSVTLPYAEYEDSQTFKRSKRYPTPDNKYFVMLRFGNKGPLQHVILNASDSLQGKPVTARICKF